jgi:hypothetical protein
MERRRYEGAGDRNALIRNAEQITKADASKACTQKEGMSGRRLVPPFLLTIG